MITRENAVRGYNGKRVRHNMHDVRYIEIAGMMWVVERMHTDDVREGA